jgi:chromate transporter
MHARRRASVRGAVAGADAAGLTATAPPLRRLAAYFLRLGAVGFGGPVALVGAMQRDLVEERRWVRREDFLEGLALAQLAPGPLAAQLAMYLGWLGGGPAGAALTGAAFVAPSFAMVVALAVGYLRFGGGWMRAAFYGIGAAAIAVMARSASRLLRLTLGRDRLLWPIAAVVATATFWTESEIVALVLLSGALVLAVRGLTREDRASAALILPPWLLQGLHGAASSETLLRIGVYFAEAGAFVFGSGLAIVPFLHRGVVQEYRWLDERQFLDAVAVAMITPGPVVITVAFIGYLVAGFTGAVVAALATFLPCYVFTVLPAPYYRRFARNRQIHSFVQGVTAAATGAIVGAVLVLGRRALVDLPSASIAAVTLLALLGLGRLPEPVVILLAGAAGLLIRGRA